MQAFVKMERKLQESMRFETYHYAGAQAVKSFGAAITDQNYTNESNLIFVSLDFEGLKDNTGIAEMGIAKVSSHQILSPGNKADIVCFNYALAKHRHRKFLFGDSTRLSPELIERTIVGFFDDLIHDDPQCNIVLVSHGIRNEIRIMDDLGVSIEALPVTGIIDTCCMAADILGFSGSLEDLLTTLRVPARMDMLHCAGNDAHYTLQALLALLDSQYKDKTRQLEKLAKQASPSQWKEEEEEGDWADYLQFDACLQD